MVSPPAQPGGEGAVVIIPQGGKDPEEWVPETFRGTCSSPFTIPFPSSFQDKIPVTSEERVHLILVLLRLQGAGGINEQTAGRYRRGCTVEK